MIDNISNAFNFLGSFIYLSLIALTVGVVANLWYHILLSLRAKRRAQYVVSKAKHEKDFVDLLKKARERHLELQSAETEALRQSIESHLKGMSDSDKNRVYQALHQHSKKGAERYLKELVDDNFKEVA